MYVSIGVIIVLSLSQEQCSGGLKGHKDRTGGLRGGSRSRTHGGAGSSSGHGGAGSVGGHGGFRDSDGHGGAESLGSHGRSGDSGDHCGAESLGGHGGSEPYYPPNKNPWGK